MSLQIKHLLGLRGVGVPDLQAILDTADSFKEVLLREIKKVPPLRGKTILNLFYEASTRTRISFELAEKRLSGDVINFTTSASSVAKGESLKDTVKNIAAMKIDMIVVRHASPGVPAYLTQCTNAVVINAGDGSNEHPTQGLLDMMTMREKKGKLAGLRVAIIGDILHSRVARSNIWGLKAMGAEVRICGPSTLIPPDVSELGVQVFYRVEEAIAGADVVMALRIQLERQKSGLFPSLNEYRNLFGLNRYNIQAAKKDALIMHPGPINRGLELSSELADGAQSVILEQVTNGVAVRMAVLYLLSGADLEEKP